MSTIDHLISKYNGITNWQDYYAGKGSRDDAPKHLAALSIEQREVALRIIGELMMMHKISADELACTHHD